MLGKISKDDVVTRIKKGRLHTGSCHTTHAPAFFSPCRVKFCGSPGLHDGINKIATMVLDMAKLEKKSFQIGEKIICRSTDDGKWGTGKIGSFDIGALAYVVKLDDAVMFGSNTVPIHNIGNIRPLDAANAIECGLQGPVLSDLITPAIAAVDGRNLFLLAAKVGCTFAMDMLHDVEKVSALVSNEFKQTALHMAADSTEDVMRLAYPPTAPPSVITSITILYLSGV